MKPTFQLLVVLMAALGLGLGAAFAGGAYYARRTAPTAAEPAAAGGTNAAAEGSPSAGAAAGFRAALGAGGSGAAATTGVVEVIADETVTIRTQASGTVTVKLQPDTRVSQLAPASRTEIKPGQRMTVLGQPDADGAIAARSVQIDGTPSAGGSDGAGAGTSGRPVGGARPSATPGGSP
jgi:hypothetical protein